MESTAPPPLADMMIRLRYCMLHCDAHIEEGGLGEGAGSTNRSTPVNVLQTGAQPCFPTTVTVTVIDE